MDWLDREVARLNRRRDEHMRRLAMAEARAARISKLLDQAQTKLEGIRYV